MPGLADDEKHDAEEHSKLVLEAMRRLADEQLDRAERVRNAARNTFLYVSALFTVAQTVAINAVGHGNVSDTERKWILGLGVLAAAILAGAGIFTVLVDRLRKVPDISTDDIEREADAAVENDEYVADRLTKLYRATARKRAKAIDERKDWLTWHAKAAGAVIVLVVAEIIVTLLARAA